MSDPSEEVKPQYSYNIFVAIKDAQSKNGIRLADYERYRQYCTRRLRRIRKSLKIIHGRKKYQKKNIDIKNISDVRYIELILFYAERAWGYAMDLKSEIEINRRAKYHCQSKFVKALQYSEQLKEMCNECADEKTKIQARTYCEWMTANLAYQKDQWAKAYFHYNRSLAFFTELYNATSGDEKEIYASKIEEIKTLVNFCKTNLTALKLDYTEKSVEENEINEIRKKLEKLSIQEDVKPVKTQEKTKDNFEARLQNVIKRSYIDLSLKEGKKVDEYKSSDLPQFIPMPCKPVLFDLALSTYERPNLEEKMKAPKSIFSFW